MKIAIEQFDKNAHDKALEKGMISVLGVRIFI